MLPAFLCLINVIGVVGIDDLVIGAVLLALALSASACSDGGSWAPADGGDGEVDGDAESADASDGADGGVDASDGDAGIDASDGDAGIDSSDGDSGSEGPDGGDLTSSVTSRFTASGPIVSFYRKDASVFGTTASKMFKDGAESDYPSREDGRYAFSSATLKSLGDGTSNALLMGSLGQWLVIDESDMTGIVGEQLPIAWTENGISKHLASVKSGAIMGSSLCVAGTLDASQGVYFCMQSGLSGDPITSENTCYTPFAGTPSDVAVMSDKVVVLAGSKLGTLTASDDAVCDADSIPMSTDIGATPAASKKLLVLSDGSVAVPSSDGVRIYTSDMTASVALPGTDVADIATDGSNVYALSASMIYRFPIGSLSSEASCSLGDIAATRISADPAGVSVVSGSTVYDVAAACFE